MEYSIVLQNGWKNDFNKADPGAFFHDNTRKIDMVLAYEDPLEGDEPVPDLESTANIRFIENNRLVFVCLFECMDASPEEGKWESHH